MTAPNQRVTLEQAMEIATQAHLAGQRERAEAIYRQILAAQPNHADALHQLGILAIDTPNFPLALDLISQAIRISASEPNYHNNLAFVLTNLRRFNEAEASCRKALELSPDFVDAMVNLGNALCGLERFDEAIDTLKRAVIQRPDRASFWNDLGAAQQRAGRWSDATESYLRTVVLAPTMAGGHLNLGTAYLHAGKVNKAIDAYERSSRLSPDWAVPVSHLGNALLAARRYDEAIDAYRRCVAMNPNFGTGHFNLAIAQLLAGDFENGWREYAWRLKSYEELGAPEPAFDQPEWDGSDPSGKTILLHAEQGLGDTIHFSRYAPLLADRGARVIITCQRELERIMQTLSGVSHVFPHHQPRPDFDLHCPLPSLPLKFKTRLETIPANIPYLHPSPDDVARWKHRLDQLSPSLKVGLAWAGSPKHTNDRNRSMRLSDFASLNIPGVTLISLQKGPAGNEVLDAGATVPLVDWTSELSDFYETASLIANLDLVISVDTSVAHLAGAMGKPAWVLLPAVPDWRWMLNRSDSPWYPTMKLLRQSSPGDWDSPMKQAAEALQLLANSLPSHARRAPE